MKNRARTEWHLLKIQGPLIHITGHVVDTQGVGRPGADGHGVPDLAEVAVVDAVFEIAAVGGVGHHLAAAAGGIFPLSFCGQVHGVADLLAEPLAGVAGLVPGYSVYRLRVVRLCIYFLSESAQC
jgi:hypothetical protein